MLKPVYFAFETMLEFFANYTFCYITSTFAKTNEQNNCDHDSFETRHFDEGGPCGEPPCTSLVQRSRMLMQKRPRHNNAVLRPPWTVAKRETAGSEALFNLSNYPAVHLTAYCRFSSHYYSR